MDYQECCCGGPSKPVGDNTVYLGAGARTEVRRFGPLWRARVWTLSGYLPDKSTFWGLSRGSVLIKAERFAFRSWPRLHREAISSQKDAGRWP